MIKITFKNPRLLRQYGMIVKAKFIFVVGIIEEAGFYNFTYDDGKGDLVKCNRVYSIENVNPTDL